MEQSEILLLIRACQELDIETLTQELRTSSISVEKRLADLMRKNLVVQREADGIKRFCYDSPAHQSETIDQLAALYITHRVSVIHLIFSKPCCIAYAYLLLRSFKRNGTRPPAWEWIMFHRYGT